MEKNAKNITVANKIVGDDVLLKVKDLASGKVLAGQQGASISRSASEIDVSTKGTNWAEKLPGQLSWSISCDGLLVADDEAYAILEEAFHNRQRVEIYVEYPNGLKYEGLAIITTADLDAPFGDACSYSFEFGGTGELKPIRSVEEEPEIEGLA